MSKRARERSLADEEAQAVCRNLRVSPRKLNLVAAMIRGRTVQGALSDLEFSRRRIAGDVRKTLQSAVANAENNHALDIDRLYVKAAFVGKAFAMKRIRPRARGRASRIVKPFSNLTIIVRERGEE